MHVSSYRLYSLLKKWCQYTTKIAFQPLFVTIYYVNAEPLIKKKSNILCMWLNMMWIQLPTYLLKGKCFCPSHNEIMFPEHRCLMTLLPVLCITRERHFWYLTTVCSMPSVSTIAFVPIFSKLTRASLATSPLLLRTCHPPIAWN